MPDATRDGVERVKQWARDRIPQAEATFKAWASPTGYQPSPETWTDSVVYNIQVDRFNNGDPTNDLLNSLESEIQQRAANDLAGMPNWRHGGDLAGITARLDYVKDLRINTLWITPVFRHDGSYHGYCTTDPTALDPGFGTAEELRDMVRKAHDRGIRVVLDVVINHLCDTGTQYTSQPQHSECAARLKRMHWRGESDRIIPEQGELGFSAAFFPPLRHQAFFNRCGPCTLKEMQSEGPETIFGDFVDGMFDYNTRNRDWQEIFTDFHKYWIAYADVDGFRLDAAKHTTEDFLAYFSTEIRHYARSLHKKNFFIIGEVAAQAAWQARRLGNMSANVADPIRSKGIAKTVRDRIRDIQAKYEGDSAFPAPGLGAVFNFQQSGITKAAALGHSMPLALPMYFGYFFFGWPYFRSVMRQLMRPGKEDCNGDANSLLWTLLEIHDWPRFLAEFPNDASVGVLGLSLIFTLPGSPVIHYGQEQGFNGLCPDNFNVEGAAATSIRELCERNQDDSLKRQDMFPGAPWLLRSSVADVDSQARVGPSEHVVLPWTEDPLLLRNHTLYQAARRLGALRSSCPALSRGRLVWRRVPMFRNQGPLVFSRVLYDEVAKDGASVNTGLPTGLEVVVVASLLGAGHASAGEVYLEEVIHRKHDTWREADRTYVDVFNPSRQLRITGRRAARARLDLSEIKVQPGEIAIFVHSSRLGDFDSALGTSLCKQPTGVTLGAHSPAVVDRCGAPRHETLGVVIGVCVLLCLILCAVVAFWWQDLECNPGRRRGATALSALAVALGTMALSSALLTAEQIVAAAVIAGVALLLALLGLALLAAAATAAFGCRSPANDVKEDDNGRHRGCCCRPRAGSDDDTLSVASKSVELSTLPPNAGSSPSHEHRTPPEV